MNLLFLTPGIPFTAALLASGGILLVDIPRMRNLIYMAFILFTAWLQGINLNWQIALITLLAGWAAGGILILSEAQSTESGENSQLEQDVFMNNPEVGDTSTGNTSVFLDSGLVLRLIAYAIACLTGYSIGSSRVLSVYGLPEDISIICCVLSILGLLQMSLTTEPARLGLGMLMMISGFEIMFFYLEPALAVQFLFVILKLAIAAVMSVIGSSQDVRIRSRWIR